MVLTETLSVWSLPRGTNVKLDHGSGGKAAGSKEVTVRTVRHGPKYKLGGGGWETGHSRDITCLCFGRKARMFRVYTASSAEKRRVTPFL